MCGARLHKDTQAINGAMATQFDTWKAMYVNLLDHGYINDMDITGLPMDQDGGHGTASGTASGKGQGKGKYEVMVPTDPKAVNGPMFLESGWVFGWKIWAGDLPRCMQKPVIAKVVGPGFQAIAVNNIMTMSGMAYCVITYTDLDLAIAAFKRLAEARFDHCHGIVEYPTVRCFRPEEFRRQSPGQCGTGVPGPGQSGTGAPCPGTPGQWS